MNRQNQQNKKGYWFRDPFWSLLKGFFQFEETHRDARKFSIEIDRVGNNMFRIGEDEKFLKVTHSNKVIEDDLNSYFVDRSRRYRESLYGQHFHLGNLFNDIMQQLVIYGEVYYSIDWTEVDIEGRKYKLPSDFRYLSTSATSIFKNKKGKILGYKQSFSPFTDLPPSYTNNRQHRSFNFKKNEVFHLIYPLENTHPVKKSMYLLKPILRFWDFTVEQSASWNSKNKDLNILRAGQMIYSEQKRKYALARAMVKKNFHYLLNTDDLMITEYYDAYVVVRYLKDLNASRKYFIDQFNEQVLIPFAKKNKIIEIPTLTAFNFISDEEIDDYFKKYKSGKVSHKEFIEKMITNKV